MSRVGGGVGQVFHFRNIFSLPIGRESYFWSESSFADQQTSSTRPPCCA